MIVWILTEYHDNSNILILAMKNSSLVLQMMVSMELSETLQLLFLVTKQCKNPVYAEKVNEMSLQQKPVGPRN